jgi:hypothetical protein
MPRWKLTIVVDDSNADSGVEPLTTAVSNLEYDGYEIITTGKENLDA